MVGRFLPEDMLVEEPAFQPQAILGRRMLHWRFRVSYLVPIISDPSYSITRYIIRVQDTTKWNHLHIRKLSIEAN